MNAGMLLASGAGTMIDSDHSLSDRRISQAASVGGWLRGLPH